MIKQAKLNEVAQLYRDFIEPYFPEDEKKPLECIERLVATGLYRILYIEEDNQVCGVAFLTTYPDGELYLLDYLAVRVDLRSMGYGGKLLDACREATDGRPILIETESLESAADEAELALRKRRNQFYQRNGAVLTAVRSCVFGVEFNHWELLGVENLDEEVIRQGIRDVYWFMLDNPVMFKKNVFV